MYVWDRIWSTVPQVHVASSEQRECALPTFCRFVHHMKFTVCSKLREIQKYSGAQHHIALCEGRAERARWPRDALENLPSMWHVFQVVEEAGRASRQVGSSNDCIRSLRAGMGKVPVYAT